MALLGLLDLRLDGGDRGEDAAEKRNEIESTSNAYGALSSCTRLPPMLGPATNENARLPASTDFPWI